MSLGGVAKTDSTCAWTYCAQKEDGGDACVRTLEALGPSSPPQQVQVAVRPFRYEQQRIGQLLDVEWGAISFGKA